ncbi:MAG: DUF3592 domain-containing protein [bacterium]|nr:DUF3592 domain-containing protein [bacterium]
MDEVYARRRAEATLPVLVDPSPPGDVMLKILIFVILSMLAVALVCIPESLKRKRISRRMDRSGKTVEGVVTDLDIVEEQAYKGTTTSFYLVYEFEVEEGGIRRKITSRKLVDPDDCPGTLVGKKVHVRYLPDDPDISRIEDLW